MTKDNQHYIYDDYIDIEDDNDDDNDNDNEHDDDDRFSTAENIPTRVQMSPKLCFQACYISVGRRRATNDEEPGHGTLNVSEQ